MSAFGQTKPLTSGRAVGLTLIELIVFILIVSVALTGILAVLNLTTQKSADPILNKQALAVAEAMLDEILAKDYMNDPADPTNGSSTLGCTPTTTPSCKLNTLLDRQNYNDVDDFDGWNQAGIYQADGSLAPLPVSHNTYSVKVSVTPTTLGLDNGDPLAKVVAKKITVTVDGGGKTVELSGYRTNYE